MASLLVNCELSIAYVSIGIPASPPLREKAMAWNNYSVITEKMCKHTHNGKKKKIVQTNNENNNHDNIIHEKITVG